MRSDFFWSSDVGPPITLNNGRQSSGIDDPSVAGLEHFDASIEQHDVALQHSVCGGIHSSCYDIEPSVDHCDHCVAGLYASVDNQSGDLDSSGSN